MNKKTEKRTLPHWKSIGIIAKQKMRLRADEIKILKMVLGCLQKHGIKAVLDSHSAHALKQGDGYKREKMCMLVDAIITIGGDGTMLKTSRCLMKKSMPLITVNVGNLGFLTEMKPVEFAKKFDEILRGNYYEDTRLMLSVKVIREDKILHHAMALNEATVNQGSFARLIKLRVNVDEQHMLTCKADGLIVATPTGSTGHSLSAGGPIIHPKVDAITITPICASSLGVRPMVIPAGRTVTVMVETERKEQAKIGLTLDGQFAIDLVYGDKVIIERAPHPARILRLERRNYYELLHEKLHWG